MILALHHVAVGVPAIDRGLAFYLAAFDCELLSRGVIDVPRAEVDAVIGIDGVRAEVAMLRFGSTHFELWQYRSPAPIDRTSPPNGLGYPHIAVSVVDINSECERLAALGMTFVGPPVDLGFARAVYGRDPFGNIIELSEAMSR